MRMVRSRLGEACVCVLGGEGATFLHAQHYFNNYMNVMHQDLYLFILCIIIFFYYF